MTVADRARNAAVDFEAKKDGLAQLQNGNWKVTFTVHDLPEAVMSAPMGTRYVIAAVEKGDNEEPVTRESGVHTEGEKRKFGNLSYREQAVLLCKDERFQEWLGVEPHIEGAEKRAAEKVRNKCGVTTRGDLSRVPPAAGAWMKMLHGYRTETGQVAERR